MKTKKYLSMFLLSAMLITSAVPSFAANDILPTEEGPSIEEQEQAEDKAEILLDSLEALKEEINRIYESIEAEKIDDETETIFEDINKRLDKLGESITAIFKDAYINKSDFSYLVDQYFDFLKLEQLAVDRLEELEIDVEYTNLTRLKNQLLSEMKNHVDETPVVKDEEENPEDPETPGAEDNTNKELQEAFIEKLEKLREDEASKELIAKIRDIVIEIKESDLDDEVKDNFIEFLDKLEAVTELILFTDEIDSLLEKTPTREVLDRLVSIDKEIKESKIKEEEKKDLISRTSKKKAEIEEKIYRDEFRTYKAEKSTLGLLNNLRKLKEDIENSSLLASAKHLMLNDIEKEIERVYKDTKDIVLEVTEEAIREKIEFVFDDEELLVVFPEIVGRYSYDFVITNSKDNKIIKTGRIAKGMIEVEGFKDKLDLSIAISVIDDITKQEVLYFVLDKTIKDETAPVIKYAYVANGIFKFAISEDYRLSDYPVAYRLHDDKDRYITREKDLFEKKDEDRFEDYIDIGIDDVEEIYDGRYKEAEVYTIELDDIPTKVNIVLIDYFENERFYSFEIKEDNMVITKDEVPDYIEEEIKKSIYSKLTKLKDYDIFELEYNKKIKPVEAFEDFIKDIYKKRYNQKDIEIKIGDFKEGKDGYVLLDKTGLFEAKIRHKKDDDLDETITILIRSDKSDSNIEKIINNNQYVVYENQIRLADYIKFVAKDTAKEVNKSFILAINPETKELFELDKTLKLDINKAYTFEILNLDTDTRFDFNVIRYERLSSASSFADIYDHWANAYIYNLTTQGLLAGYPDGTFNPEGNITVREFATILSRYISINPNRDIREINQKVEIGLNKNEWSYWEVRSITDRLRQEELNMFSLNNLDREITREEVAFLISRILKMNESQSGNFTNYLQDITSSNYSTDITALVNSGVINGYPDSTFKPYNQITRAEIAAVFSRI